MHNSVSILTKEKYNSASILLESMRSIAPHVAWCARLGNNGLLRTRSVPTGLYMLPFYILLLGSQTFSFTFSVVMNTIFILITVCTSMQKVIQKQDSYCSVLAWMVKQSVKSASDVMYVYCIGQSGRGVQYMQYTPHVQYSTVYAVHSSCTVQYTVVHAVHSLCTVQYCTCSTLLMYSTVQYMQFTP